MTNKINYQEKELQRALALAIRNDNFFEVHYLIEVCCADAKGYTYCVEKLEEYQVIPEVLGMTIAEYAGKYCDNPHIFDLLFRYGMDVNTTFKACIKRGAFEIVTQCLIHKADPNLREENGETVTYNHFQAIMNDKPLRHVSDERIVTLGILYHMGYKDDGDRILNIIKQSYDARLLEILDIYTPDAEERVRTMNDVIFFWNSQNPHKCPDNYFNSGILKPIDKVQHL